MNRVMRELWLDDEGATIIEYVLLAALISIVSILAITAIGTKVNTQYEKVDTALP